MATLIVGITIKRLSRGVTTVTSFLFLRIPDSADTLDLDISSI
jgi:hypothetical protein